MSGRDVAGRGPAFFPAVPGFVASSAAFSLAALLEPGVAWFDRIDMFGRELFQGRG